MALAAINKSGGSCPACHWHRTSRGCTEELITGDGRNGIVSPQRRCCVGRVRSGVAEVVPGSDGTREFGEDCLEPMLLVDIDTEFVVAAAQVLDEGVPGTDHVRRREPFQSASVATGT